MSVISHNIYLYHKLVGRLKFSTPCQKSVSLTPRTSDPWSYTSRTSQQLDTEPHRSTSCLPRCSDDTYTASKEVLSNAINSTRFVFNSIHERADLRCKVPIFFWGLKELYSLRWPFPGIYLLLPLVLCIIPSTYDSFTIAFSLQNTYSASLGLEPRGSSMSRFIRPRKSDTWSGSSISTMAKLGIATLEGMEGVTRNRMRRGVLHVGLTPGPDSSTAAYQPPSSGGHSSRPDRPVLLRFPVEVLKNILEYLEPIWLIQVAAAYPDINTILGFEQSNRIWYDALPAALFLEPESFQDEVLVENRKMVYTSGDGTDTTLQLSTNYLRNETFYYGSTRSSRFALPVLLGLSELSLNLDFSYDITHPHDRRFYPTTPTRVRVMALGGPYQPWLDYRQEITGHLHYNMRCCICLELTGRYRRYKQIWGLKWCIKCFDLYMLNPAQVSKIPGLDMLIKRFAHVSRIRLREKPQNHEYRPMVDEILRARIGIDFETAVNVQCYILQLLQTWKGGHQSEQLRVNRSRLRRDIVKRAQEIWQGITLQGNENLLEKTGNVAVRRLAIQKKIIVHARERWAPASVLPTFLFHSRLLTDADLWLPYDPDEQWLPDPTLQLETSRDVLRAGTGWVDQKAREMLLELVIYKPDMVISTWVKAAEQWHIQRITQDLYSGKYLNLEYGGHRLRRLEDVGTPGNNRLDVIAKKLRIDPLFPVGTLTEHENKMAVASFIRLIRHRCAGCPINNLLILPCGLKEIVQHFGQYHPYEFWLNDKWTVRG